MRAAQPFASGDGPPRILAAAMTGALADADLMLAGDDRPEFGGGLQELGRHCARSWRRPPPYLGDGLAGSRRLVFCSPRATGRRELGSDRRGGGKRHRVRDGLAPPGADDRKHEGVYVYPRAMAARIWGRTTGSPSSAPPVARRWPPEFDGGLQGAPAPPPSAPGDGRPNWGGLQGVPRARRAPAGRRYDRPRSGRNTGVGGCDHPWRWPPRRTTRQRDIHERRF